MNQKKISSLMCLLCLFFVYGTSQAASSTAGTYRIDMTLSLNGSLIGKPALVAKAGSQAEIRDENPMKLNDGFRILVTASPLDTTQGDKESIKLEVEFFGRHQGKWIQRAKHSVTTISGQSVSFAFPSTPPEEKAKTYDLVLTVSQNDGASAAQK